MVSPTKNVHYTIIPGNFEICPYEKHPLNELRGCFLRCLAESNRCSRFCRPVPNRSAKAPFLFWDCKYSYFFRICKINYAIIDISYFSYILSKEPCHLWGKI